MCAVVGADHLQGDTGVGDFEWVVGGGGVCDSDILPGGCNFDGICAAGGRNWWRTWIVAGDDGAGRGGLDVPTESASGADVCYFVVGGIGVGGLQQSATGAERGNAGGDLHFVVDYDIEWTDADFE